MKKFVLEKRLCVALLFLLGFGADYCRSETVVFASSPVVPNSRTAPSPTPSPAPTDDKKKAPRPQYIEIGKSVKGRPIAATVYGDGKKRVLVLAGIHGNESDTSILAKALIGSLGQEGVPKELTIIIVPDVNPDGLFVNTRVNAAGVDINRNFPSASWRSEYTYANQFPGIKAASEPETRAVIHLIEHYPPDFIITLHAALGCVNWDGPAEALARVIAPVNGYPLCPYLGYETPGSLGAYMGVDRKVPVVTIELRNAGASELIKENLPALRAVLTYMASAK